MKKRLCCLLLCTLALTGCSAKDFNGTESTIDDETTALDPVEEIKEDKTEEQTSDTSSTDPVSNISDEVKDYILNGQENKPEAEKIKWSASFLNQLDIDSLYNDYILAGGSASDVDEFAKYITLNAPIPSNWQELFAADLKNAYGVEPSKIEYLEGDLYQAYIINEGSEVPYVTVSARTGYFHG